MTTEEKEKYGPQDPGQKIFPSHFWNASKTPYPFSPMSPSIFLKPHSCSSKRLQPINFCLSLLFLSPYPQMERHSQNGAVELR